MTKVVDPQRGYLGQPLAYIVSRPRLAASLAWAFCIASVGFAAAGTALNVVIGDYGDDNSAINKWSVATAAIGVTMPVVGALIASRRPDNVVGWLLCGIGLSNGLDTFVTAYAIQALIEAPGSLPGGAEAAWMSTWDFAPGVTMLLIFLPLLFPEGRLLSPRWRIAVWLGFLELFLFTVPFAVTIWPERGAELLTEDIPEGAGTAAQVAANLQAVALLLGLTLASAAVVSIAKRYLRADGHERLQLKWFGFAVAAQIVVTVVILPLPETSLAGIVACLVWSVLIPAGVGIAILRHRLYGIDLLINRTLVYLPLTGILAGLYVALTGLSRTVFTELTDAGSDAAIALSTLGVVALLTPLENQLQAFVDRHFKENPDPLRTLKRLTGQARAVTEVIDTDRFVESVLQALAGGIGAEAAAVELAYGRQVSFGQMSAMAPVTQPLLFRGEEIGTLSVWPRAPKASSMRAQAPRSPMPPRRSPT